MPKSVLKDSLAPHANRTLNVARSKADTWVLHSTRVCRSHKGIGCTGLNEKNVGHIPAIHLSRQRKGILLILVHQHPRREVRC